MAETAEEAVVAKEARIVEEVVVSKDVDERVETVHDTVKRTGVHVEPISAASGGGRGGAFETNEADFRRHWAQNAQGRGISYEQCDPAYRYGCDLGTDPRYTNRDWSVVEPEARRRWEERNPGTWEQFAEPVQYSWNRVRQGRRAA